MDSLRELLEAVRERNASEGHFLGLLHVLVGRRIAGADGSLLSAGMTWRDLAGLLKRSRWDREAVRELGVDPGDLAPRDRERYWYVAIARAGIDTPQAVEAAEKLIPRLTELGYTISPAPGAAPNAPP